MKAKLEHPLTPQQQRVVQCLVDGYETKAIAIHLNVALTTIRKHKRRACVKLGAKTIEQMVALAVHYGCVQVHIETSSALDTP